jgi:hypothetical protein
MFREIKTSRPAAFTEQGRGPRLWAFRPVMMDDNLAYETIHLNTTMSEFDAYLMVDWSACSRPARGTDSIWYRLTRTDSRLSIAADWLWSQAQLGFTMDDGGIQIFPAAGFRATRMMPCTSKSEFGRER